MPKRKSTAPTPRAGGFLDKWLKKSRSNPAETDSQDLTTDTPTADSNLRDSLLSPAPEKQTTNTPAETPGTPCTSKSISVSDTAKRTRNNCESWRIRYPWIIHDVEQECIFCSTCQKAYRNVRPCKQKLTNAEEVFIQKGYTNYKKALEARKK